MRKPGISKRKLKRYLNHLKKKLAYGRYFEDCGYHPCVVTESHVYYSDLYASDVVGRSLINDQPTACSMFHCAPLPISEQEAKERVLCIKNEGWHAYLKRYIGYDDASLEEYEKLNKVWNFTRSIPNEYLKDG